MDEHRARRSDAAAALIGPGTGMPLACPPWVRLSAAVVDAVGDLAVALREAEAAEADCLATQAAAREAERNADRRWLDAKEAVVAARGRLDQALRGDPAPAPHVVGGRP